MYKFVYFVTTTNQKIIVEGGTKFDCPNFLS